jgi:hypothetical protein
MGVPEQLQRFVKAEARTRLAERFALPASDDMQDWPWEVADPVRLDEFLAAYEHGGLSDDERFILVEIILESFEESGSDLAADPRWVRVLNLIAKYPRVHAGSVWYWAALGVSPDPAFRIAPFMRELLAAHKGVFGERLGGRPTSG